MTNEDYEYIWKSRAEIDSDMMEECSRLFSEHYGVWGATAPSPGARIRLSAKRIETFLPEGSWAVLARHRGELVGYALGVRTEVPSYGTLDWVTQLVVHVDHRRKKVATWLLFTFWGFSDHRAWGLITSNPFAVRALERITHRRCDPAMIRKHADVLMRIGERIPYAQGKPTKIDEAGSIIDTMFPISHARLAEKLEAVTRTAPWTLGRIREGEEWFAFVFREQEPGSLQPEELKAMLDKSEQTAKLAYARMDLGQGHAWATYADREAKLAKSELGASPGATILDVGCGRGRHVRALAQLGYHVTGVDFVASFIEEAKNRSADLATATFVSADARIVDLGAESFAGVICLYDVIGTFPEQHENQRILDNIARHLRPGGRVLGSVMNMELTEAIARRRASVRQDPRALQELPPSKTMQTTGAIFDPEYFLLDPETSIIYRKEQFDGQGKPPGEFIVRDRRYTRHDIEVMCSLAGLSLVWTRPVALGRWDEPLDPQDRKAKEILFVAEKPRAEMEGNR